MIEKSFSEYAYRRAARAILDAIRNDGGAFAYVQENAEVTRYAPNPVERGTYVTVELWVPVEVVTALPPDPCEAMLDAQYDGD